MRVCLFLDSAYPTEKAYGVTTSNTLQELVNAKHTPTIVCKKPNNSIIHKQNSDFEVIYFPASRIAKGLEAISGNSFRWYSKVAWKLLTKLNHHSSKSMVFGLKPDIIWTREEPAPKRVTKDFSGISVIEIHQKLNSKKLRKLKQVSSEKLIICPISLQLKRDLERFIPEENIVFSPMGIVPENKSDQELRSEIANHYLADTPSVLIGYFGKLSPTGHSKGFEDLFELGAALRSRNVEFKLRFVGLGKGEEKLLEVAIRDYNFYPNQIEIFFHQEHSKVIRLMRECDFLILPRSRDANYLGFPLKALEYVSSGRAVLAARTNVNVDVFVEDFQPFWYEQGDFHQLAEIVISLRKDADFFEYLLSGIQFARRYSWKQRTSNILNKSLMLRKSIDFSQ